MEYLDLLDRALEDRLMTGEEANELLNVARRWGLSRAQVDEVHRHYIHTLIEKAVDDNKVTGTELKDLSRVGELLGYGASEVAWMIQEAQRRVRFPSRALPQTSSSSESLVGLSVCFSGDLSCHIRGERLSRKDAEDIATKAGLVVVKSVTRKLDLLVVADPHSPSAKTRKAREYGTRIMAEEVFWQKLGIAVD